MKKKKIPFHHRKAEAKKWVENFEFDEHKNIIKCYGKQFSVDRLTAINELLYFGVPITDKQIERAQKAVRARKKSYLKEDLSYNEDQDENFYYIAGYTDSGFPYGITWQEMGLEPFQEPDE